MINPEHGKRCRVPAICGIKGDDAAALGGLVFRHFAAISFPNARHDLGASGVGVGRRRFSPCGANLGNTHESHCSLT